MSSQASKSCPTPIFMKVRLNFDDLINYNTFMFLNLLKNKYNYNLRENLLK
jgi:hypothetical protein